MRFMGLGQGDQDSEAGVMPTEQLIAEMGKFNEELVKAGVMLAGDGLQASSKGARIKFADGKRTVIDGPFAETKELVAGFWMIAGRNRKGGDRVVPRACPAEVEIRQVFDAPDFESVIKSDEGRAVMDKMREFRNRSNT